MVFDPDSSNVGLTRGFTAVDPADMPASIPGRSLSDNMGSQTSVTGDMRTDAMNRMDGGKVEAYKTAQKGTTAEGQDSATSEMPETAKPGNRGQGAATTDKAKKIYDDANGPVK